MTWRFIVLTVILVGLVAVATMFVRTRSPRRRPASRHGTVVRDIPAGGFGQVRLGQTDQGLLLAARSAGGEFLPAGTVVEIVDDSRSVILVRRLPDAG